MIPTPISAPTLRFYIVRPKVLGTALAFRWGLDILWNSFLIKLWDNSGAQAFTRVNDPRLRALLMARHRRGVGISLEVTFCGYYIRLIPWDRKSHGHCQMDTRLVLKSGANWPLLYKKPDSQFARLQHIKILTIILFDG